MYPLFLSPLLLQRFVYNILQIYISAIRYKFSSFEKHKMLNLLGNLIAKKTNILIHYTHLLHKFIIHILDCPSVI
jgi:hypothetical protein